jgi:hypothetical protein
LESLQVELNRADAIALGVFSILTATAVTASAKFARDDKSIMGQSLVECAGTV